VDRGGVGSKRGFVGPGACGFPGRGGAAAAAGAWSKPLFEPTPPLSTPTPPLELGQVVRERDQPRSHAAKAVSRAEVLGGQLAEATERLAEASARARTLAEILAVRAQARCWRSPSRWISFRPCRRLRPGQVPPRVETSPRVLLLPLPMSEPARTVCLKHAYVFRGR
jgi:hypothetical protein